MKYTIKKGNHYSNFNLPKLIFSDTLKFKCSFDKNCLYEFINKDSGDLSKLVGLSDNYIHMKDSIRIGWRNMDNSNVIELHVFAHVDSKMISTYLCSVEPNTEFIGSILIYENVYMVDVTYKNTTYSKTIARTSKFPNIRYMLKPYFGGDNTAPHDMTINIDF